MHPVRAFITALLLLPHWTRGLLELAALQAWRVRDRLAAHRH